MAYDPNDAKDKEIVDGLIAEAVELQTTGLKSTIEKLKGEKKKLQQNGNDPETVSRLEAEVEKLQGDLAKTQGDLKTTVKDRDKAAKGLETESAFTRNLLVDNGLTNALTKAKVAANLLPGAKALLQGKVVLKQEGDKRTAMIGEKSLDDFVTEWSQSDEGKAYVTAPANNGADAKGGGANSGAGKTVTRLAFNAMQHTERAAFAKEGGTVTD